LEATAKVTSRIGVRIYAKSRKASIAAEKISSTLSIGAP
jgi:hypothetical protein